MAIKGARVHVYGDWDGSGVKKAEKDLSLFEKQVNGFSKGVTGSFSGIGLAAGAALAGAGYAVTKFLGESLSAASDLSESQSKVSAVFRDQAGQIEQWASRSALAFGQSKQQALEAAGTYGNLFQAFGLSTTAAREMSTTMVELAADLASFNNTSIDDAIEALRSGLSGETEPLKRFGIALNDSRMKAEAMALGIYDGVGALNAAQKAQAAYAVILSDTQIAQGDFERTSTGLANTMRIMEATVSDAKAEIGQGLLQATYNIIQAFGGSAGLSAQIQASAKDISGITYLIAELTGTLGDLENQTDDSRKSNVSWINQLVSLVPIAGTYLNFLIEAGSAQAAEAEQTAITTNAWADYRRAQQGVVKVAPAVVDSLNAITSAASTNKLSAEEARSALTNYAISTGQVPTRATWGQRYDIAEMLDNIGKGGKSAAGGMKSAGEELTKLQQQFGKPLAERANELLGELKDKAKAARDEMLQFYDSIKQNVASTFSLSAALDSAKTAASNYEATQKSLADATRGLADAQDAEAEARKRHDEVMADSDATASQRESVQKALADAVDKTAEATKKLTQAQQDDSKAADENGKTYIQRLQEQAGAAQQFLQTITTLYEMGLRGEALRQIGEMSATAGITVGTELINGGEAAITETMRLVDATNGAAAKIAELTTAGFIGTGVITADNTVKGFADVMGDEGTGRKKLMRIMDRLAADMRRETTITVTTIHRNVYESVGLPGRAMGGPVSANTAYVVGERGPEVFVPDVAGTIIPNGPAMSNPGAGVGGGINLTVNAGMGTNGAEVGRQIVDALKQYTKRNGPVPITVA